MAELPELFIAEWEEALGDGETKQRLNPAWDKYVQMELAGTLYFFAARDGKKLVGYIITILHPHLHFRDMLYAFVDALYLKPKYRDGDSKTFVLENEAVLKAQGAEKINISIPPSTWQYRLMKELNYARTECTFAKWLQE